MCVRRLFLLWLDLELLVGVTVFGKIRTASEVGAAEKAQHFEPELFGQKWQWVPHDHVAIV